MQAICCVHHLRKTPPRQPLPVDTSHTGQYVHAIGGQSSCPWFAATTLFGGRCFRRHWSAYYAQAGRPTPDQPRRKRVRVVRRAGVRRRDDRRDRRTGWCNQGELLLALRVEARGRAGCLRPLLPHVPAAGPRRDRRAGRPARAAAARVGNLGTYLRGRAQNPRVHHRDLRPFAARR